MFEKKVRLNSRKEMVDFLSNHFRYYTMNSWNRMTSYANNVKLYNLDIPDELRDKAYDFLYAQHELYNDDITELIREFTHKTGYSAGFNGRNDGYIVMYDTEIKETKTGITRYTLARGIDEYADFEDWDIDELKERVKLVQAFDELCDKIREIFLWHVENSVIKDVDIIHTETIRVAEIIE